MSDLFMEKDRGARAEALLRDETLLGAFDVLENGYMDAWLQTTARDAEGRERLLLMVKTLHAVKSNLEETVTTGKFASMQLEQTE